MDRLPKCPNGLCGQNRVPLNVCGISHSAVQRLESEAEHTASSYAKDERSYETTPHYMPTRRAPFKKNVIFFHGCTDPSGSVPPHCRDFTITLRHTTLGRSPPDETSVRRRDLYLTTHNIHNRQISMPSPWDLNPQSSKQAAADPRLRPRGD